MMGEQVEGRRLKQQIERLGLGGRRVRDFYEAVSLELALRLQPPGTDRPIGVEHETVVPQLARRAACFTRCCVRLQQFELTAVVYDAHRQRTFLAAPSRGPFAVQGAEAGIVELAFRRMQIGAVPPRRGHAPTERAARSFGTRRTAQLEVVRRA